LFSGPSGTGKTLAAEVMAMTIALHLYRVDLSKVVNKYIGETEKNLKGRFLGVSNVNMVLFFDEADALFGKRTEVTGDNDRYANLESNFLFQVVESFTGMVLLTTNLRSNLDRSSKHVIPALPDSYYRNQTSDS
jgi:SpoVK/Ycf46/Vps4 family AAA+-type ATPase